MFRKEENPSIEEMHRVLEQRSVHLDQVDAIIARWVKTNPGELWRWLESRGNGMDHFMIAGRVFDQWLLTDPDAALEALRHSTSQAWNYVAERAIAALFTTDEKTRAKLLGVLDELVARGAYLTHRNGNGLEEATKLLTLPPSKGRDTLLAQVAQEWVREDWSAVANWTAALTEPLKSEISGKLASTVLDFSFLRDGSPEQNAKALAWAGEWFKTASRESRQRLGSAYVQILAPVDGAAALAWAQENLQGAPLARAVSEVLSHQASQDPAKTRTLVEEMPPGGLKTRALFAAAGTPGMEAAQWLLSRADATATGWREFSAGWASRKPEEFQQFISSNGTEGLPEKFLATGTRVLASRDPAAAMTWATGLEKNDAASIALDEWSRADAPAAAAWIKEHPNASLHTASIPSLADQYFRRSASDAADWVVALPPGPARDESIAMIRKQLSSNSVKPDARAALESKLGGR